MITKGSFLAQGIHGTTPSGTSAYFSVDIGLIHIAALSTKAPEGDELEWLTRDLENANNNRKNVSGSHASNRAARLINPSAHRCAGPMDYCYQPLSDLPLDDKE